MSFNLANCGRRCARLLLAAVVCWLSALSYHPDLTQQRLTMLHVVVPLWYTLVLQCGNELSFLERLPPSTLTLIFMLIWPISYRCTHLCILAKRAFRQSLCLFGRISAIAGWPYSHNLACFYFCLFASLSTLSLTRQQFVSLQFSYKVF